jgi:hypothetical protein
MASTCELSNSHFDLRIWTEPDGAITQHRAFKWIGIMTRLSCLDDSRVALPVKHSNYNDGFWVNPKVHCVWESADEGPPKTTFARSVRERVPKHTCNGRVQGVSKLCPESGTTILVPLERLKHVDPGFLS